MSRSPLEDRAEAGDYGASWSALNKLLRRGYSWSGREENCAFLNLAGRDFATTDAPGHGHTVNLKLNGARPFIDAARIYALAHGIAATNTAARLRSVRKHLGMGEAECEALVGAFFEIQRHRLRMQAMPRISEEGANLLDPDVLNPFERRVLKEAFLQARALQSRLALDYQV